MDQVPNAQPAASPQLQNVQGAIPPQPTPPISPKKNYVVMMAVILMLLFVAISIGYFLSKNAGILSSFLGDEKQELSDGTYSNKEYDFSFEYPSGFEEYKNSDINKKRVVVVIHNRNVSQDGGLTISIAADKRDRDPVDKSYGSYLWTKTVIDDLSSMPNGSIKERQFGIYIKQATLLINGVPGIKYEVRPKATGKGIYPSINIAFEKDDRVFLIAGISEANNEQIFSGYRAATFDRIVSTFKIF